MMDGFGRAEAYGEIDETEALRAIGGTEAYGEINGAEAC